MQMIKRSFKSTHFFSVLFSLFLLISCKSQSAKKDISLAENRAPSIQEKIIEAANDTQAYFTLLKNKKVAVVANQTSVIAKDNHIYVHLIDSLLKSGISVSKVFAPEHGFRGKADAGEHIEDGKDTKTGLPIISLHGKSKKPSQKQLEGIDIVIFDIQDVGVRFYTYIATLQYVMEACAEARIPIIVLDRPNPNAHYIDGPTLEIKHRSFLGLNPIPLVYGMTIGEYAKMVNGEGWLTNGAKCDLTIIPLQNYTHQTPYSLAIRPSPNLPNDKAINLYPSLGLFEGTTINAGRGTEMQFQIYGAPFFQKTNFNYTPEPNFGAKYPKHKGELCNGYDLRKYQQLNKVNLEWLINAFRSTPKSETFFGKTFTSHAGNTILQKQIEQGLSAEEIRKTWQKDIDTFKKIRKKYLIYKD